MKILIVAATEAEILPFLNYCKSYPGNSDTNSFVINHHLVYLLISGPGSINTTFEVCKTLSHHTFDLAINAGIAGSFHRKYELGSVVQVTKDRFADLGSEDSDGLFHDIFEINLADKNKYPYHEGWLYSEDARNLHLSLPMLTGITVNKVTGSADSIEKIQKKYEADIETMEGAAFFFTCSMFHLQAIQIRSVSNFVEPRNKENWKIKEAVTSLNITLIDLIRSL